jgi:hypothetical protein
MRYLRTKYVPKFDRVLLIESGSRELFETFIPWIYRTYGDQVQIDLVTCYAGEPHGYKTANGRVFRVTDYAGAPARQKLYAELAERNYSIVGIICSAEPIMTKWKWVLATRLRSKMFVLNENGDWFWVDYSNWKTIRHFFLFRAGLSGAEAVPTIGRLLLFPLTFAFLAMYAAFVHLRRKVHI